jgi:CubicO group peptidase (beta-lactamase class C family)
VTRIDTFLCWSALLALPLAAQGGEAASREGAGLEAEVDRIFAHWDRPDSPGCALGVIQDGRLIYRRGYGMANLEHEVPNGPRTVFDLGSTSKQFTAACVMLLAIDGRLSLDDDIRKHVPEIPDYGRTITVRHLVHHTSGIRDYLELMLLRGTHTEDLTTTADALALLSRQRAPNFPAGEEHLYSNSGYFLLSVIVSRVSGQSLAEFAKQRIFDPLGMRDTRYQDDHTRIVPRRATGYAPRPGGGFGTDMSDFEQTGDGAVMSTVEDLFNWERNFTTRAVGGDRLFDLLHERGKLANGSEISYAAGLVHGTWRGLATVSHGGAWAGYRAELLRFPERRFSVICICNLGSMMPSVLAYRVAAVYLRDAVRTESRRSAESRTGASASAPAGSPPTLTAEQLAEYAGRYSSDELMATYDVAVRAGGLAATCGPGDPVRLRPEGPDRFSLRGPTVTFKRSESGAVTAFEIDLGRARGIRFERVPATRD